MSAPPSCVVCSGSLTSRDEPWAFQCRSCGTWVSTLSSDGSEVDTDVRVAGLEPLRRANFRVILDRLQVHVVLAGARVLDVGCAYGWFLDEAQARGATAIGIEPDAAVAAHAENREIRNGLFPDALDPKERFDLITFNDVLEHMPDAPAALDASASALNPGGILSINIPTSDGLAFRLARLLRRFGIRRPLLRLWQYGLGSPHVHYFPRAALAALVADHGFDVVDARALPAIKRRGLWARMHTLRPPSPATIVQYVVLYLASPVLNRDGASDIVHVVARRRDTTS